MQKLHYLVILLFGFIPSILNAQINTNELPPSMYSSSEKDTDDFPIYQIEVPNIKALEKQDKIDAKDNSIPWRFGTIIEVDFDLTNSGLWTIDSLTGISNWKLRLKAEKAVSINLNFKQFVLSKNAKLYFYNEDYSDILGAVTAKNNKRDSIFSIRPMKGEELNLELEVPSSEIKDCIVKIHEFIYGYRSVHDKALKNFSGSGNCNINVNCPGGDNWQDVKRAVAMITTAGNTRECTGTLLNNVRQDSTPYLLTAAHCKLKNNSIFIFNYESADCSPSIDGSLSKSISGASPRAISNSSQPDFHLFELSSKPPSSYNVYYAGWSAVNTPAPSSTTIHHPVGDVMKISTNSDSIYTSGNNTTNGTTHWTVNNWESGTTQPGSSGAALFDQNQRVIGQLQGGDAACGNNAQDYFGKFAISWNGLPAKNRQLKAWLDPDTTNTLVLDGLDPNASNYDYDLQVLSIHGFSNYMCDTSINPILSIRNRGNKAVDTIQIRFQLDNGTIQTINKYDSIKRNQVVEISLPELVVSSGNHQYIASVTIGSNGINDQDTSNNSASLDFLSNDTPIDATFTIKTDDYGQETSWVISSNSGVKLYGEGPYETITGGAIYSKSLCLYDSCFNLTLYDFFGDGFNGIGGNGYTLITDSNGDTLVYEDDFRSDSKTINFCVPSITSLSEYKRDIYPISVYPNPVPQNGTLTIIDNSTQKNVYNLIDMTGRKSMEFTSNSIKLPTSISAGIYFLVVKSMRNNDVISYQKIIVK